MFRPPTIDCKGKWEACSPETIKHGLWGGFSAAGYYFGRELNKQLKTPIGLIHTSWGGTPAEFWTSKKALEGEPKLKGVHGSGLYNGMIAPLLPFAIRGAIWYQGESNLDRAFQYRTLLPTMIHNWRADWGQGDFPFYIVQIAPFSYSHPEACAELWEARLLDLSQRAENRSGSVHHRLIGELHDIQSAQRRAKKLGGGWRFGPWPRRMAKMSFVQGRCIDRPRLSAIRSVWSSTMPTV